MDGASFGIFHNVNAYFDSSIMSVTFINVCPWMETSSLVVWMFTHPIALRDL
jgi:hypothetical protein